MKLIYLIDKEKYIWTAKLPNAGSQTYNICYPVLQCNGNVIRNGAKKKIESYNFHIFQNSWAVSSIHSMQYIHLKVSRERKKKLINKVWD